MLLLTFQADHFWWKPFSKTLESAETQAGEQRVDEAVVVFLHAEPEDLQDRPRAFKHTLKHIKWVANKRELRNVVLHSFTHLGTDTAEPDFARGFLEELADRLRSTGYEVAITPFGYFCEWQLKVYGESMAKVFKKI